MPALSLSPSPPAVAAAGRPRPAVILPGLGNNSGDYARMAGMLRERHGVECVVARVSRADWLRNAAGLLDDNYWRCTLRPRPVLDWYLKRVDEAVSQAALLIPPNGSVSLIGHSAGGWLARVYMEEFGASNISLLLTLGTPHLPPPKGVPGVIDQTRGLLNYVEEKCAPAVYSQKLRYVCIAGRYIQGARLTASTDEAPHRETSVDGGGSGSTELTSSSDGLPDQTGPTFRARFIGQGYKQVCGRADVWGDGVVPETSAHLEGALNLSFDGVYHSPVGSDDTSRPWYGSPAVLEKWVHHLLE